MTQIDPCRGPDEFVLGLKDTQPSERRQRQGRFMQREHHGTDHLIHCCFKTSTSNTTHIREKVNTYPEATFAANNTGKLSPTSPSSFKGSTKTDRKVSPKAMFNEIVGNILKILHQFPRQSVRIPPCRIGTCSRDATTNEMMEQSRIHTCETFSWWVYWLWRVPQRKRVVPAKEHLEGLERASAC